MKCVTCDTERDPQHTHTSTCNLVQSIHFLLRHAMSDVRIAMFFPDAKTLGCHLHQFIVGDPLYGLLESEKPWRLEANGLI